MVHKPISVGGGLGGPAEGIPIAAEPIQIVARALAGWHWTGVRPATAEEWERTPQHQRMPYEQQAVLVLEGLRLAGFVLTGDNNEIERIGAVIGAAARQSR